MGEQTHLRGGFPFRGGFPKRKTIEPVSRKGYGSLWGKKLLQKEKLDRLCDGNVLFPFYFSPSLFTFVTIRSVLSLMSYLFQRFKLCFSLYFLWFYLIPHYGTVGFLETISMIMLMGRLPAGARWTSYVKDPFGGPAWEKTQVQESSLWLPPRVGLLFFSEMIFKQKDGQIKDFLEK